MYKIIRLTIPFSFTMFVLGAACMAFSLNFFTKPHDFSVVFEFFTLGVIVSALLTAAVALYEICHHKNKVAFVWYILVVAAVLIAVFSVGKFSNQEVLGGVYFGSTIGAFIALLVLSEVGRNGLINLFKTKP